MDQAVKAVKALIQGMKEENPQDTPSRRVGASRHSIEAMTLPAGWPFPGQDMSHARFDISDEAADNKLATPPAAASVFGPLAPASEQQIEAAGLSTNQQPAPQRMLSGPGPAVFTAPGPVATTQDQSGRSAIQPAASLNPVFNQSSRKAPLKCGHKTAGRPSSSRPQFNFRPQQQSSSFRPHYQPKPFFPNHHQLNTHQYNPAAANMQFSSQYQSQPGPQIHGQSHGQGRLFNMAGPAGHQQMHMGVGLAAQNNFYPQPQGQGMAQDMFAPQNTYRQTEFSHDNFTQNGFAQNGFSQNNFSDNHFPQNDFSHNNLPVQNNFTRSMVPQNQMMAQGMLPQNMVPLNQVMMSPSPVPAQYQHNLGNNQGAGPMVRYQGGGHDFNGNQIGGSMVPYNNFQMERAQQRPFVPSVTQPWATKYVFDINNTPPFIDITRHVSPSEKPIISIKNIPYTVTHNEVQQFLSKSLLPHSHTYLSNPGAASLPIHVVMERGTGKTEDAYIELPNQEVANICIERVENLIMAGKPPKMAQRIVDIEMSSQGELMKEIFPRAKNLLWDKKSGIPVMKPLNNDPYSSGFRGFLTGEEMNNVVRYAEVPQRSPFAVRCQQRTYEMTISTLSKFPWASTYYSLEHRNLLFKAYINQLQALLPKVFVEEYGAGRNQRIVGLDARLVAAFVAAGVKCPGFNEAQKTDILDLCNQNYYHHGLSEYGPAWPFETLTKPAGVGDNDLDGWLRTLKEGVDSAFDQNIDLIISKDAQTFIRVRHDQFGQICMQVSDNARGNISFVDLAAMETKLMKLMLNYGWEANGKQGVYLIDDDDRPLTEVERKMLALGVYKHGTGRPGSSSNDPGQGAIQSAQDNARSGSQSAAQQGSMTDFDDPFQGRPRSVASDSGFAGMHRGMDMNDMTEEIENLAMRVQGSKPTGQGHTSAEKGRPSYAQALGSMLVNTENANAPARTRGGSNAVPIKNPDGQELDFTKKLVGAASSKSRHGAAEEFGRTFDPFNTPRRRSGSSAGSSNVSPHTKTSPKKSYTIKAPPAQTFGPIGTPSRRSMQDNTVTIGDTISEEGEEESIMMRGGRRRGQSRSFN